MCGGLGPGDDVTAELIELQESGSRHTGLIQVTNHLPYSCKLYGPADVRTDGTGGSYTKLTTGVLGDLRFITTRERSMVINPGEPLYHAVSWVSASPAGTDADCTSGSRLVLARNEGKLYLSVPVKDGRFCASSGSGSPQVMLGAQLSVKDQARAQLQSLPTG
ncbi:hypothetical protein GCM10009663_71300 [Kitasatospora arboriphila]|uniref:DUF4232 domain-containing protein n=1 Tax=Kitasatospora arboriphila TaxID=258052 RepID=A0ABP4EU58_9ACTN